MGMVPPKMGTFPALSKESRSHVDHENRSAQVPTVFEYLRSREVVTRGMARRLRPVAVVGSTCASATCPASDRSKDAGVADASIKGSPYIARTTSASSTSSSGSYSHRYSGVSFRQSPTTSLFANNGSNVADESQVSDFDMRMDSIAAATATEDSATDSEYEFDASMDVDDHPTAAPIKSRLNLPFRLFSNFSWSSSATRDSAMKPAINNISGNRSGMSPPYPPAKRRGSISSMSSSSSYMSQHHRHHRQPRLLDPVETKLSDHTSMGEYAARALPHSRREREFDVTALDKVFASVWLNDFEVVLGTKCNRLFVLNVETQRRVEIPAIVGHRSARGWSHGSVPTSYVNDGHSTVLSWQQQQQQQRQHQQEMQELHELRQRQRQPDGGATTEQQRQGRGSRRGQELSENSHCCGIHSIAINPSRTMIAVGSGHPTEFIQIYSLPSFAPIGILSGHTDMVFSVAWVSDTTLLSGSRDTTLRSWSLTDGESVAGTIRAVDERSEISLFNSEITRREHRGKVRDLKFNPITAQAATLSTDGTVKIFDASLSSGGGRTSRSNGMLGLISSIDLAYKDETVCLGLDLSQNIYAVGSASHISLIDPRASKLVHFIESCDEKWGVRSMAVEHGMLTIGGGCGRISFYDLRAQGYLSLARRARNVGVAEDEVTRGRSAPEVPIVVEGETRQFIESGRGWLNKDAFYMNHFRGTDIRNAVYTLSYDPSGVRLFAAGGPLQLNLCGSYAAIWE
ncbi:DDB1- and CUL4-associated factor 12 [Irineochytrium annulatum]|nr:DDB1- and CUL4-associated factor 12 [Irineochytrium annulatum]